MTTGFFSQPVHTSTSKFTQLAWSQEVVTVQCLPRAIQTPNVLATDYSHAAISNNNGWYKFIIRVGVGSIIVQQFMNIINDSQILWSSDSFTLAIQREGREKNMKSKNDSILYSQQRIASNKARLWGEMVLCACMMKLCSLKSDHNANHYILEVQCIYCKDLYVYFIAL